MRLSSFAAAMLFSLGLATASPAQDCPPTPECPCPGALGPTTHEIDDAEDAKALDELELRLQEILVVDENGVPVLRKEFAEGMPFPADRVQAMLGSFVELDAAGKIKLKDREAVKPYLPMIKRFLSPESMQRMRDLQNLPPEQRREAMRRMMGPGGPAPTPTPTPAPTPTPEPRRAETPRPAETPRDRARPREDGHVEERLTRLERQLSRIEELLERGLRGGERGDRGDRGDRGADREQPRRGGLGDLFGRRQDDRGLLQRAEVWGKGLRRLSELATPEDMEAIGRALGKLRETVGPEDLRDRGALLNKLQDAVDPADIGRLMELFSEFMGSAEGRALAAEIEQLVKRLEQLVDSPEGERMGKALERLEGMLGRGDEKKGDGVREQLERLIRPRGGEERQPEGGRLHRGRGDESRPERRPTERPRGLPDGARLY